MWYNYFKIAWRNIVGNKLRTVIHIFGLGIGIAVCFLIYNVISYSYSFDNFHPNKDKIFQVTTLTSYKDQSWPNTGVPFPLAEVVDEETTGILDKAHFYTLGNPIVTRPLEGKNFGRSKGVVFSDAGIFTIFQREWLAGNASSAMELPNALVLTESSLVKYFPGLSPGEVLGKELAYIDQDTIAVRVTGVVKDYVENSDFTFTDFISKSTIATLPSSSNFHMENWNSINSNSQLFIQLDNPEQVGDVMGGLAKIEKKYIENEEGGNTQFFLQPLSDLHFTGPYTTQRADKSILKGLMVVGLIILMIACMNFINLETAQAIYRNKEVGIRKTLGSSRKQLILQFLVETYVFVFMGIIVSFLLSEGATQFYRDYLPTGLQIDFFSFENILFLTVTSILLTILSGLYPAFILSKYKPDAALKFAHSANGKVSAGLFFRKNLTLIQFTLSVMFVIGVFTINKQMGFLSRQQLGFDKEWVTYARTPYHPNKGYEDNLLLKEKLKQQSFVQSVSLSSDMVASTGLWTSRIEVDGEKEKQEVQVQVKVIDQDYVEVNGLKVIAGRNISDIPEEVLINEELANQMGFDTAMEAIGKPFDYDGKEWSVVGVIQNFHSRTLRESILPMILFYQNSSLQIVNVRLESGTSLATAKNTLDLIYKEVYPMEDMQFEFLDETVEQFYEEDAKLRGILSLACGLAILISCMGLFGLTSFTISRRLKEISIRKVLGASIFQILYLVSREYMLLMLFAFLLGSIPAWLFLNHWLQSFSFRIDMPWILFLASGLLAMVLCLLIVGAHSLKAAHKNPAEILKSE